MDPSNPSTLGLSPLNDPDVDSFAEAGPNDLLELAESIPASEEPRVIRGDLSDADDVDVYDLGSVSPGDHLQVAVSTDSSLPTAIALFDDTGALLLVNDHRNVYMGRHGPFVDVVIRRASTAAFLALSITPGYESQGEYDLVVTKTAGAEVPSSNPDTMLLVFNGASSAKIGTRSPVDVPPFDAAFISPNYRGRTDELIAQVVSRVREDYAGYNVTFLSTSEGAVLEDSMTRIFFGTFDAALLGVAEGIDEFNDNDSQEAIVFTDTFEAFMQLDPTLEEMAQALANVASHEAGHLLGLVHTSDPNGIMDVTASLSQLMVDQYFTQSPLYREVFPVGFENEVQSLLDSVGGNSEVVLAAQSFTLPKINREKSRTVGQAARTFGPFSSCCLKHGHH